MHRCKEFSSNINNIQSILKTSTFSPSSNWTGGLMSCITFIYLFISEKVFPKTMKTFIDIHSMVPVGFE